MSVLKDRAGDIHVNVPVGGSLSAPEFHYGEAVWAAIRNMAIRLVALPFSLIGKLFFTEDSRIASVAIDPVHLPDREGRADTAGRASSSASSPRSCATPRACGCACGRSRPWPT